MTLTLIVSKVDEKLFGGEAVSVTVPGIDGEMTILPQHEPFISPLQKGKVVVRTKDGKETFEIDGGTVEVSANQAVVLV